MCLSKPANAGRAVRVVEPRNPPDATLEAVSKSAQGVVERGAGEEMQKFECEEQRHDQDDAHVVQRIQHQIVDKTHVHSQVQSAQWPCRQDHRIDTMYWSPT